MKKCKCNCVEHIIPRLPILRAFTKVELNNNEPKGFTLADGYPYTTVIGDEIGTFLQHTGVFTANTRGVYLFNVNVKFDPLRPENTRIASDRYVQLMRYTGSTTSILGTSQYVSQSNSNPLYSIITFTHVTTLCQEDKVNVGLMFSSNITDSTLSASIEFNIVKLSLINATIFCNPFVTPAKFV